jgi:hypothetical protein
VSQSRLTEFFRSKTDALVAVSIFSITLFIFWFSPIYQVSDSHYSMLVSESLLHKHTFRLDSYAIPRGAPVDRGDYVMPGNMWQLELVRDHLFYFPPPGSSVLAIPYVALMNSLGVTATNPDGSYNPEGEIAIETSLAALLMAFLSVVFFLTARLVLPTSWSVLIALSSAFGTQVLSTASRALGSDTWGIFLFGFVVWILLAQETGKRKINPVVLGTLLAWSYIVRPTNAVHVIAISIYILLFYRRLFLRYAVTGAVWAAGFFIYSWHNFGQLLPNYYRPSRLSFNVFLVALPGNLISPSRGLFVYVPVLLFVGYLLIRYRRFLISARLAALSGAIIVCHVLAVSGFRHWWGGNSYGPRFMTGLVPWFVLLGILGVRAMLDSRRQTEETPSRVEWPAALTAGALLLAASVFINARGALSYSTIKWHESPVPIEQDESRLWDWRRPQFLAGLLRPPLPPTFPITGSTIDLRLKSADKYVWYGWSASEGDFRWTDETEAALIFALDDPDYSQVRIALAPFLVGRVTQQRMFVKLNGAAIGALVLTDSTPREYSLPLAKGALKQRNGLTFEIPDATSPRSLRLSIDQRVLGVAVRTIEFER